MANYEILNESDEVINVIIADENFVAANYSNYRLRVEPEATEEELAQEARQWRDTELQLTDYIVPLSDHPQRAAYMTYRTALRDWPSTGDFPTTKPNNPNYVEPEEPPPPE
jgi:hypothetical protein